MRLIVAGDLAGARGSFGGIGAQWANLTQFASGGLAQDPETAARAVEAQNAYWQRLVRDRRDNTEVARQLPGPLSTENCAGRCLTLHGLRRQN